MTAQLDLPLSLAPIPRKPTTEERAAQFHEDHPQVMESILAIARRQISEGATRLSMLHLYAEARARFKIHMDNSYMPWYTREFVRLYPQYRGLFELRKTDKEKAG